jgi:hypothetical protein
MRNLSLASNNHGSRNSLEAGLLEDETVCQNQNPTEIEEPSPLIQETDRKPKVVSTTKCLNALSSCKYFFVSLESKLLVESPGTPN